MKKKELKTKQTSLALRKETLGRLENSELRGAVGAVRMWRPVGFAGDTTPIYDWVDEP